MLKGLSLSFRNVLDDRFTLAPTKITYVRTSKDGVALNLQLAPLSPPVERKPLLHSSPRRQ